MLHYAFPFLFWTWLAPTMADALLVEARYFYKYKWKALLAVIAPTFIYHVVNAANQNPKTQRSPK